jgi:putative endonuclease
VAWPDVKKLVGKFFENSPEHLIHGRLGEQAAKKHLQKNGLKFLTANFSIPLKGEVDLIFREEDCLVFVEVKTRSSEEWTRPADAVDKDKRERLVKMSLAYRRKLPNPHVKYRYDIVEVLLEAGEVREIRHIKSAFTEERSRRI